MRRRPTFRSSPYRLTGALGDLNALSHGPTATVKRIERRVVTHFEIYAARFL